MSIPNIPRPLSTNELQIDAFRAPHDRCTRDLCDGLFGCFREPGACGDFNGDGHTDLPDFLVFHLCMNGPSVPPSPPAPFTVQGCLEAFDLDMDGDVDIYDFNKLANSFGL